MCGITGFTHKNWVPDPQQIRNSVNSIIHRGPDQQGVFESKTVSLGAARLKIIDLGAGNQPIIDEASGAVIVFNGEIYNNLELRAELERRGHRFQSHCDTETVLRGFLEWDVECFKKLRGMYAAAIWKPGDQRLVLVRDRMGIKPLYLWRRGEDIYFGSELKTILSHPEFERNLSLDGLDCYLSLNYVPYPWTLVDGITKLQPGHWLEWVNGKISEGSYWELPTGGAPTKTDFHAAQEELDQLLKDSIREHFISDVPVGVWLSGGVDSSTILHYAATQHRTRLKTFSISFRGRSFDETTYIREAVKRYGTDHEEFDCNPDADLAGAIEQMAYFSDEPTADAGALPVWFLSKMSKTTTTVDLSGEGGDELFGGYLTYRANDYARLARRLPAGLLRIASQALQLWPVSNDKISFEYKLKRFLEGSLLSPARAHVHWNGTFTDEAKQDLLRRKLPSALDPILGTLDARCADKNDLAAYLWFDQKYFLTDDILMKVDRMSMAHSVEVRPPFLDHRIVEFAAALPDSFKIRGSQQKVILKELMKDKLPTAIRQRKKTGLDIPAHDWLRGPLKPLLLETLREGAATHNELFDGKAIENLLTTHLERRENLGYHLWGLLTLFLWMKTWKISA